MTEDGYYHYQLIATNSSRFTATWKMLHEMTKKGICNTLVRATVGDKNTWRYDPRLD